LKPLPEKDRLDEANVRGFLIAEMSNRARRFEAVRSEARDRDKGLLEWEAWSGGRRSASPPIAEEHSRVSPMTPLPARRASTAFCEDDDHGRGGRGKAANLATGIREGQKAPPREQFKSGMPGVGVGVLDFARGRVGARLSACVVKVVSYAHGSARASATANYVDRDDAVLETHEGIELKGREAINAEIGAWSQDFEQRAESQDVSAVRLHVVGLRDGDADRLVLRQAVEAAFKGHSYAYRIETLGNGAIEAHAVIAFAGLPSSPQLRAKSPKQSDSASPSGRSASATMGWRKGVRAKSEARMKARIEEATGLGQHRLSIEPGAPATDNRASSPPYPIDRARAGDLEHRRRTQRRQRDPSRGSSLASGPSILLAARHHALDRLREGGDGHRGFHEVGARLPARAIADHKFMFGVHTDKAEAGHIHAHAIVTVRNAEGRKSIPVPRTSAVGARPSRSMLGKIPSKSSPRAPRIGPLHKVTARKTRRSWKPPSGPDPVAKPVIEPIRAIGNQPLIDNARRRIETARENPSDFQRPFANS